MSLKPQLENMNQHMQATMSTAYLEVFEQGIKELKDAKVASRALNVGDVIPTFNLPNATGGTISSDQLLDQAKLVISFYRGGWCPYCNLELLTLKQYLDSFERAPATLIAISPDVPDESLSTQEKHQLAFPVLSDPDNQVAKQFGLVFSLHETVTDIYHQLGFKLTKVSGSNRVELPLAATYVVDQSGIIRYAFVEEDYRLRAEPEDVLYAVRTC